MRRVGLVNRIAILGFVGIALTVSTESAWAQPITAPPLPTWETGASAPAALGPRAETVLARPRADYDPIGFRQGPFILYPMFTLAESYDTNVFATQSGALGDWYTTFSPYMSGSTDWNTDYIGFLVGGDVKQYSHLTSENVNNFTSRVDGRYDIQRGEYISVDAVYLLNHEDRSSPDSVHNAKQPIEYKTMGGGLSYVHEIGRLGLRVDAAFTSYDFNDSSTITGVIIPQNFRDRNEYAFGPRLNYEIIPGYNAFVRAIGNERQYFSQEPGAGPQGQNVRRNSHGFQIDAGTAVEISRIMTGEIYVGYLQQDYENPLLPSVSGPSFGGNLIWNVTPLTSVLAAFAEAVGETTLQGASSTLQTAASIELQHELLLNLLLRAQASYVRDDYQGNPRKDNTFGFTLGARYMMDRHWRATANLTYSERDSNVPGGGYNRVVGIVGLTLGF